MYEHIQFDQNSQDYTFEKTQKARYGRCLNKLVVKHMHNFLLINVRSKICTPDSAPEF